MQFSDLEHLAPSRDHQFVSMGFLCQLLQVNLGQLRTLMEECEIKFARVVDGIGYFCVADAEAVAAKCRDVRKEIHEVSNVRTERN